MKKLISVLTILMISLTGIFFGKINILAANQTGKVTADVLNVRSGPGTNYSVIGTVYYNNTVTVTNTAYDSSGAKWYKITYTQSGTSTGYVSSAYITITSSGTSSGGSTSTDTSSSTSSTSTNSSFESYMNEQGFPDSYKPMLRKLHSQHPKWIFKAQKVGIDWYDALAEEMVLGRNLVHLDSLDSWKSMEKGAYNFTGNYWIGQDSYYWVPASRQIVAYYLDPRNFLDDTYIFMFENLSYNPTVHTITGVQAILADTFMKGTYKTPDTKETISYAKTFMDAAKRSGVSPYHLASRCRNEQGVNGAPQSLGTVKGYENYFNFFDVQAYATSTMTAAQMGCKYAKTTNAAYLLPWTNQYKSIVGGSIFLGTGYISKQQDTLYFQKFDVVDGGNGYYYHQYMTCVFGQANEAAMLKNAYTSALLNSALEFKIPVYNNMPSGIYKKPTSAGDNNNLLKSLSISGYSLDQSFDKYTMIYSATINDDVDHVNISAPTLSSYAKVSGAGKVAIVDGLNTIKISVTAPSGALRNYYIKITKKPSNYPAAVKGFKSTSDINSIKLTWDPVNKAQGYIVYKYDTAKKSYVRLIKTTNTNTSYTVSGLKQAQAYKFAIKAYRTISGKEYASKTFPSLTAYTYLPTVTTFKSASDINSITLKWNKISGAQGYVIYEYDSVKKSYSRLIKTTNTSTSYIVSKLDPGTEHKYAIRAYTTVGSKEVLSKSYPSLTAYTYLPAVTNFKATGDINTVKLTWTKTNGAQGYVIYWYNEAEKSYIRLNVTTSNVNTYTAKDMSEGSSHKFAIRAYKKVGSKEVLSKTYPVATTVTKLNEVGGFKATPDVNSITLTWNKNDKAKGYVIYEYNMTTKKYSRLNKTYDNITSFTVNGLNKASKYQYAIRAYTTVDDKEILSKTYPSVYAYTYLPTVTDFKADADLTYIKLTWNKVDGAKGYIIYYYDQANKSYVRRVNIGNVNTITYTFTGMTPQKPFQYAVRAYTTVDNKEILSKSYPVVKAETYVPDVKNFNGVLKGTGAELSWTKMNSPQGFVIYQYNTANKKYERLTKTSTNITSYVINKAIFDKSNTFAIRAYKTLNGKEYLSKTPAYVSITKAKTLAVKEIQETVPYSDE